MKGKSPMARQSKLWLTNALLTRPMEPRYARAEDLKPKNRPVIAVPFNTYADGNPPDRSNAAIAGLAHKYLRREKSLFIGQREHTNILSQRGFDVRIFESEDCERVESQRLVGWQANVVHGLSNGQEVILVGLPDHLGRVAMLCEYFGLVPIIPPECKGVPYDSNDRLGAQWWCKTPQVFRPYEMCVARPGTIAKLWLGMF